MLKRAPTIKESDSYFEHLRVGPRDPNRHSKIPLFIRLHGSVFPVLILPLLFVGGWAALIHFLYNRHPLRKTLLVVLGFLVGLALSFRSTTAYERYSEGRRYWATLQLTTRNLARLIWVHIPERQGPEGVDDVLQKLSALNLLTAFALSLKHQLRFEPFADYEDIKGLVGHLDTYAKAARPIGGEEPSKTNFFKHIGEYLGVTFAISNPRKAIKRARMPLGHLPLEILNYLSVYVDHLIQDGIVKPVSMQNQAMQSLATMAEVLTGTERIVSTPLALAYDIAISQITWAYILLLPFQLVDELKWKTIPATVFAAYVILGLAAIGREVENPFGSDPNDLPLDLYCEQIANEIDIITSNSPSEMKSFMSSTDNFVLYPLSKKSYGEWKERSREDIQTTIKTKVLTSFAVNAARYRKKRRNPTKIEAPQVQE